MHQHDTVGRAARTGAALVLLALLVAQPPAMAASGTAPQPLPWRPQAVPVLVETLDTKPVDLRVGPHRFRIPRHYFRHPPHPSGVDDGFALRVLLPGMEPITEANRHVFRMPFSTEEGRRKAWMIYTYRADIPHDGARWRLENQARGRASTRGDAPPHSRTSSPPPRRRTGCGC